ncbi:MAG: hypothetical protein CVU68_12370, partial [Deltaproteobacteria bacterium HGW-Deltaproteobacteria-3]
AVEHVFRYGHRFLQWLRVVTDDDHLHKVFYTLPGVKKNPYPGIIALPWIKILLTIKIASSPGLHRIDGSGAGLVCGR